MNATRLYVGIISLGSLLPISMGTYAADVSAGKVAATQCAICHGVNGEGNGVPGSNIAGMDVRTFKKHLYSFKNGTRKNFMMERFANRLSDRDIENLAAYFATQKL